MQLNELSLFTGIGGGLLGTKLLGWRHIGYVEIDEYCQRVLEQRIKDGILDDAPIFGDIREFNQTYAKEFKGVADVITAGFPCQPFSVAGKRAGASDERNMWPATIESIRIVRPRYALLENVPGLLTSGYFGTILRDLAESGYDIRWRCLSAAEVGANHRRNRLWILADSTRIGRRGRDNEDAQGQGRSLQAEGSRSADQPEVLADTDWSRQYSSKGQGGRGKSSPKRNDAGRGDKDVADTTGKRCQRGLRNGSEANGAIKESRTSNGRHPQPCKRSQDVADTEAPECNRDMERTQARGAGFTDSGWWLHDPAERPAKSRVGRLVDGIPDRVERLKAIGNAQVPAVVRAVWELLNDPE